MNKKEMWIEYIKVFACILVAIGHFWQSMIPSNILQETDLYKWFIQTIYYFHVPLFFICSGYLYQKYSRIDSFADWRKNILKKTIVLGIPFFTFSIITWILKTVFSNSITGQARGLIDILFFHPDGPYWYLYCLFFIFLITPTISNKIQGIIIFGLALLGKSVIISAEGDCKLLAISSVLTNEIWFVLGMILSLKKEKLNKIKLLYGYFGAIIFFIFSVIVFKYSIKSEWIYFLLGEIACIAVIIIFSLNGIKKNRFFDFISEYTLPIYLMHTIFAATLRAILLKLGIVDLFTLWQGLVLVS